MNKKGAVRLIERPLHAEGESAGEIVPYLGLALRAAPIGIHANFADDYGKLFGSKILQMHQYGGHRLNRPDKILTAFASLQMVYQPYPINTKTLIDLADIFLVKNQISPRLAELWHDFSPFLDLPWVYSTRFWPSFQEPVVVLQFIRNSANFYLCWT